MDIEKELQNVLKLSPFRNHYKNDDNFLKLLSKITTKVTTKYNLKVEDLKSVISKVGKPKERPKDRRKGKVNKLGNCIKSNKMN